MDGSCYALVETIITHYPKINSFEIFYKYMHFESENFIISSSFEDQKKRQHKTTLNDVSI